MKKKILSVVLLVSVASIGVVGITSASYNKSSDQVTETRKHMQGKKQWSHTFSGKRWVYAKLTEEEKLAIETMSHEEKKAFLETKKSEMQEKRSEHKAVIEKLFAWEGLTASEEATRLEMLAKMQDDTLPRRNHRDIIEKLLAGDELTSEELAEKASMKEKHEMRYEKKMKRMER